MNSIEAFAIVDPDEGPLAHTIRLTSDECVRDFVFGDSRRILREFTRSEAIRMAWEDWRRDFELEGYRVATVRISLVGIMPASAATA